MTIDLAALVQPVRAIAQEASRLILDVYNTDFSVTEKADKTPVTEADMAAHESIVAGLTPLIPDIPILSEEAADIGFCERNHWERLWLVDPLDGTREFIKRNGQFSVNIALIQAQQAIFGLIMIPITGVCYFAYRRGGAFKQLPTHKPSAIRTRRVGRHPVRVTGSRAYAGRTLQAYLAHLGKHDYMGVGSALKSCLVAEGKADLYPRFGPTCEWDTAAAQVIVEEAGGGLTNIHRQPLRYNARPTLINPDFFVFGDPTIDWSRFLPSYRTKT